ncbi:MAG: chemotaxis protein CheW [Planctomycetota bacterium]
MTLTMEVESNTDLSVEQYATFHVGNLLLGVDIRQVQEINRQLDVTAVPQAPECVRGVINLRGEVTTVIDLRTILGLEQTEVTRSSRNLIVNSEGESVGFLVDSISDILSLSSDQISPPPTNIKGVQGKYFLGVHTLDSEILVLLNVEEALADRGKED